MSSLVGNIKITHKAMSAQYIDRDHIFQILQTPGLWETDQRQGLSLGGNTPGANSYGQCASYCVI